MQSVLKKNNEELLRKVPSKIYEVILLWKKRKKNWFVNISEQQGLLIILLVAKIVTIRSSFFIYKFYTLVHILTELISDLLI